MLFDSRRREKSPTRLHWRQLWKEQGIWTNEDQAKPSSWVCHEQRWNKVSRSIPSSDLRESNQCPSYRGLVINLIILTLGKLLMFPTKLSCCLHKPFLKFAFLITIKNFKPWLNGVARRRKLKTWVYVRLRLVRTCVHLRWLAMTCAHFDRDQICTQVKASFSPFGRPTQVNASWVTSINLLSTSEIEDNLP